ncbi:hypothetical protein BDP27DRAFT_1384323 [Rhodocollybia butyracea]|uniref:DNA repair protein REV1 n=1 Tax=Rhodocollybia butyracea TaxID=206335 RepID=A0A9P5U661_9AGAR|nr:hypothetical protein BDP27DRAFT_1384323 [Rhodocollybia butyracea]
MATSSNSSDYFSSQGSEFLEALAKTKLPGDIGYDGDASEDLSKHGEVREVSPPPPNQKALLVSSKRKLDDSKDSHDEQIYGAARFGDFGQYMKRKRAKLQIQNKDIARNGGIFHGISIYINGYTNPSIQVLRELIVRHGGVFQPYLDKKTIVTHIVTNSLTPAKIAEWKHMKVVRPEWLVDSVDRDVLLPWSDYIWKPNNRSESTQGARSTQSTLPPVPRPQQPAKSSPSISASTSNRATNLTVPSYAAHDSNPLAQRAMHSSDWRAAHTSVAPDFIDGYYKNSRLHHLSSWKAELKELLREAQEKAESMPEGFTPGDEMIGQGRAMPPPDEQRVIMHCDFDCFFVAAGLTKRPDLKGKPVVVCHSQDNQGGLPARDFGIKNGMSLQQARKLYTKKFSLEFYTVLMMHADDLQAVSVDEALIEVTWAVSRLREKIALGDPSAPQDLAKELAEQIRTQVRKSTGCEISIGISHNISLARLATRRAKPAKSYHLVPGEVHAFLGPLDIANLHGFGRAAKQKALDKWGTSNLGDLEEKSKATLGAVLGKATGETLYNLIRGIDERKLENDKERKSVSCDINYGIRFQKNEEVQTFLRQMAKEVAKRLDAIQRRGRSINVEIEPPKFLGHGVCDVFNKQMSLSGPGGQPAATSDEIIIADHAWRLLKSLKFDPKELRGLGIQIQKLENTSNSVANSSGQGRLPFLKGIVEHDPSTNPSTGNSEPSSMDVDIQEIEIPASGVDQSVYDALPQDIKQELETEYKRRSVSPFVPIVATGPVVPYQPAPNRSTRPTIFPFPRKMPAPGGPNVRRITAQLDPAHSRSSLSRESLSTTDLRSFPASLHGRYQRVSWLKLDIDPEVFAALPRNVQREQLTAARMLKTMGYIPLGEEQPVVLRPAEPDPGEVTYLPPPKARFVQPPTLKQAGPTPGEKLYFIETDDVQKVIEQWVTRFKLYAPNKQDIAFFAKWLVKSVDQAQAGDEGLFRAVAVMKWWLVLLKRWWGRCEFDHEEDEFEEDEQVKIGKAWWAAFRDVKGQMDNVARQRFGGKLSLR